MSDVVLTRSDAGDTAPLLIVDEVLAFLGERGVTTQTDPSRVRVARIGDGHSNLTYRLDLGDPGDAFAPTLTDGVPVLLAEAARTAG